MKRSLAFEQITIRTLAHTFDFTGTFSLEPKWPNRERERDTKNDGRKRATDFSAQLKESTRFKISIPSYSHAPRSLERARIRAACIEVSAECLIGKLAFAEVANFRFRHSHSNRKKRFHLARVVLELICSRSHQWALKKLSLLSDLLVSLLVFEQIARDYMTVRANATGERGSGGVE